MAPLLAAGSITPMLVTLVIFPALATAVGFIPAMAKAKAKEEGRTDWSFLKNRKFWLLTGLLFCQNAAETSVNGWLGTYFKGSGILTGTMSAYTVTVMWSATLTARMLIAFVIPLKPWLLTFSKRTSPFLTRGTFPGWRDIPGKSAFCAGKSLTDG